MGNPVPTNNSNLDLGELYSMLSRMCDTLEEQANLSRMYRAQMQRQINFARTNFIAETPNPAGTLATITAVHDSRATLLISSLFAVVPAAAGAFSINIGPRTLGPLPNPVAGFVAIRDINFIVQGSDVLSLAVTTPTAGIYLAFFGQTMPTTLAMEAL